MFGLTVCQTVEATSIGFKKDCVSGKQRLAYQHSSQYETVSTNF